MWVTTAVIDPNDAAGGQDVFHVHFHVVPRSSGDEFDTAPWEIVAEEARIDQAHTLRGGWSTLAAIERDVQATGP